MSQPVTDKKTINSTDLINEIAELTEQVRPLVRLILEAQAHVASRHLYHGRRVKLTRLGILEVHETAARAGTFTGKDGIAKPWTKPASRRLHLRPEAGLKQALAEHPPLPRDADEPQPTES